MSPDWVRNVLNKLENNNPVKYTIKNAKNSGKLNTGLVGVIKNRGINFCTCKDYKINN